MIPTIAFEGNSEDWATGDLSSVVPDGAILAVLRIENISDVWSKGYIRAIGETGNGTNIDLSPGASSGDISVVLTSARTISYKVEGGGTIRVKVIKYDMGAGESGTGNAPIVVAPNTRMTIKWKQHDMLPLQVQLEWDDGVHVDLGGSTVKLILKRVSDGSVVVNSACTVNATTFVVSYAWAGSETGEADLYKIEWEVTFSTGKKTFPEKEMFLWIIGDII